MDLEVIKTPKLVNVQMLDKFNARNPSIGILYLTATHLIFVDHTQKKETWILVMHISTVDRLPLSTAGSPLLVRTKTFQSATFVIPKERDCHEMHTSLLQMSQPVHIEDLYCFHYATPSEDLTKSMGWDSFDLQNEYLRMNVPNDQWTLCTANRNYELCDTYPSHIYVPASASTSVLLGSARFRSKGRLPALSYLHHNKAAIARCSQPLSGFSARCMEDEQMLECVRKTNPNCGYMFVVDTRPRINAMANRAAGKGYENEAFYENIKFQFMGIENIHVMRSSLQKVIETCDQKAPSMSSFYNGLESSQWLRHIKSILETSWWMSAAVADGVSVVVHCSDGWDRTAQVCSLSSIFLNPYYRTINGFQALIEKDWLSFGHKFTDRCGHINSEPRERSPVFTQLLDATWQLTRQQPKAFQFNERFLLNLHDHAHAAQYGTFVGNCQKDRVDLRLSQRTFSLWGYMANHINEYKNPLYDPRAFPEVLKPNLMSQNIRFWRGMYCRYENGIHPREPIGDLLLSTIDHSSSLEDHIKHLSKRISSFKNLILNGRGKISQRPKDKDFQYATNQNGTVLAQTVVSRDISNTDHMDNKYLYENQSSLSQRSRSDEDHPLKPPAVAVAPSGAILPSGAVPPIAANAADIVIHGGVPVTDMLQIEEELASVALDWKSLKNVKQCVCSTPFDHFSIKHHCWRCGGVFCTRCIDKRAALPGLSETSRAPVCRPCYVKTTRSTSVDADELTT